MFARLFGSTEKQPEFTPKSVRDINLDNPPLALQVTRDGRLASVAGCNRYIQECDTSTGQVRIKFLEYTDYQDELTAIQVLHNKHVAS